MYIGRLKGQITRKALWRPNKTLDSSVCVRYTCS